MNAMKNMNSTSSTEVARCRLLYGAMAKRNVCGVNAEDIQSMAEYHNDLGEDAKQLSVPEQHQLKIAKRTLQMSDEGALIMGGMSKEEARRFLASIGYSEAAIKKLEA